MQIDEIENCEQLLKAWDADEIVWSVEMGGMGPGYEQAIQRTAFEIVRYVLENPPDFEKLSQDEAAWEEYREKRDAVIFAEGSVCKGLGLSGAQFGAASSLAHMWIRRGYKESMRDPQIKERLIQVNKKPV